MQSNPPGRGSTGLNSWHSYLKETPLHTHTHALPDFASASSAGNKCLWDWTRSLAFPIFVKMSRSPGRKDCPLPDQAWSGSHHFCSGWQRHVPRQNSSHGFWGRHSDGAQSPLPLRYRILKAAHNNAEICFFRHGVGLSWLWDGIAWFWLWLLLMVSDSSLDIWTIEAMRSWILDWNFTAN